MISECKIHTDILPGSRHKQLFTLGFVWLRSGRQKAARDLLLEAEKWFGFYFTQCLNYFILLKPDKLPKIDNKMAPSLSFPTLFLSLFGDSRAGLGKQK